MTDSGAEASGNLALDLLNTVRISRGQVVDILGTPDGLRAWLRRNGLWTEGILSQTLESPASARVALIEAHRLRLEIYRLVEAFSRGRKIPDATLFGVNRFLEASCTSAGLTSTRQGLRLEMRDRARDVLSGFAPFALAAARLVTTVQPSRVRRCASARCLTWFVDTSKGGRRRWCSMSRCGNRTKAERHRRKRTSG